MNSKKVIREEKRKMAKSALFDLELILSNDEDDIFCALENVSGFNDHVFFISPNGDKTALLGMGTNCGIYYQMGFEGKTVFNDDKAMDSRWYLIRYALESNYKGVIGRKGTYIVDMNADEYRSNVHDLLFRWKK